MIRSFRISPLPSLPPLSQFRGCADSPAVLDVKHIVEMVFSLRQCSTAAHCTALNIVLLGISGVVDCHASPPMEYQLESRYMSCKCHDIVRYHVAVRSLSESRFKAVLVR